VSHKLLAKSGSMDKDPQERAGSGSGSGAASNFLLPSLLPSPTLTSTFSTSSHLNLESSLTALDHASLSGSTLHYLCSLAANQQLQAATAAAAADDATATAAAAAAAAVAIDAPGSVSGKQIDPNPTVLDLSNLSGSTLHYLCTLTANQLLGAATATAPQGKPVDPNPRLAVDPRSERATGPPHTHSVLSASPTLTHPPVVLSMVQAMLVVVLLVVLARVVPMLHLPV
jgi:hypothetical protein